jgi:hypothetical protein
MRISGMFSRKKIQKSFREKILEILIKFSRKKFRKNFREKILKTNENKYTQVGFNILGLNIGPKNRAF